MAENKELKKAREIIQKYGETGAYNIATWILNRLEQRKYCIWQTYDKENLQDGLGRMPTDEEMEEMQERLADSFEYIRP